MTKDLGVGILVSEYTYIALKGSFRFKEMGSIHVKGRTDPVLTYTLAEGAQAGVGTRVSIARRPLDALDT